MNQKNDLLDRMRIASPCSVGWERMKGDERVRFCDQCNLHVYNISELTRAEINSLVASSEGRICARLYRRADGTVLTRDCPVGLRALRKRISRRAGAALTAILSLFSGVVGQSQSQDDKTCTRIIALKVKKTAIKDGQGVFSGVVMDEVGAVVSGAKVRLTNEQTKEKLTIDSSDNGEFKFSNLAAGKYLFEIEAVGFKPYKQQTIELKEKESVRVDATLQYADMTVTVTVGVLVDTPMIEHSNGTTVIKGEYLRKLPLP